MTSELEQKFYDTFGIEPLSQWHKCKDFNCIYCDEYEFCSRREFIYPRITSDILLKLICILNDYEGIDVKAITVGELKEELLSQCIEYFSYYPTSFKENADLCKLHNQIQQLFKGVSE